MVQNPMFFCEKKHSI